MRSPAHLKSKMLQNPRFAVWMVAVDASMPSPPKPLAMQFSISGVWMKAAQFPHNAFLASLTGTPNILDLATQNPLFGLDGTIGP